MTNFNKLLVCPDGHKLGNITYKTEVKRDDNSRSIVRKIVDEVFYCQSCNKFFKCLFVEAEFMPKTKEAERL